MLQAGGAIPEDFPTFPGGSLGDLGLPLMSGPGRAGGFAPTARFGGVKSSGWEGKGKEGKRDAVRLRSLIRVPASMQPTGRGGKPSRGAQNSSLEAHWKIDAFYFPLANLKLWREKCLI